MSAIIIVLDISMLSLISQKGMISHFEKKYSILCLLLGADYMSRASPANRADAILSPLIGA